MIINNGETELGTKLRNLLVDEVAVAMVEIKEQNYGM
jgi:hypothetical protein